MQKPITFRDKFLIIFCYRVFKFSANDPILFEYIKSKFSCHEYNHIKQLIKQKMHENLPLDEIYTIIKSLRSDQNNNFEDYQIYKEDENLAYRLIVTEPDFKAHEIILMF